MNKPPETKPPEEVSATVKLPKALHGKLTKIAAAEGKSLNALLLKSAKDLGATYEQTSKTVKTFTRKK